MCVCVCMCLELFVHLPVKMKYGTRPFLEQAPDTS